MYILSPSVLGADFKMLGSQIKETETSGARYLHLDVMDGIFVPSISFGMPLIKSIRKASGQFFDVHLMIVNPERYIKEFVESGADGITFHLEATENPKEVIDRIHKAGIQAGISIKPGTLLEEVYPYLSQVEMVLLMSVEPGFGGQAFLPEALPRIRQLRDYIDANKLFAKIEVDGGIDKNNIREVIEAGADIFVAGSAVFKAPGASENVRCFMQIFEEYRKEDHD